jgi:hypothetical protein
MTAAITGLLKTLPSEDLEHLRQVSTGGRESRGPPGRVARPPDRFHPIPGVGCAYWCHPHSQHS